MSTRVSQRGEGKSCCLDIPESPERAPVHGEPTQWSTQLAAMVAELASAQEWMRRR